MEDVLALQSEMKDPYAFYARMRDKYRVYHDENNKIWAVYTYVDCEQILQSAQSGVVAPKSIVSKHSELHGILNKLARLTNDASHTEGRAAAMHLMSSWSGCDIPSALHSLMGEPRLPATIDWVNDIAKRLPAFALMRGFGFSIHDSFSLLAEIENLVKLMGPVGNDEELDSILKSVRRVKEIFNTHFSGKLPSVPGPDVYLANFIGLLIQSYDATRGLLSNALLHFVKLPGSRSTSQETFVKFVKESARLDPAVQNTRRTIQSDIMVGGCRINRGEQVLVVLASANRDPQRFSNADSFLPDRTTETLSFGSGIHKCIADHFSTQLAASLLHHLSMKYSKLEIQESEIQYEPRINVRLPRKITLIIT